MIKALVDISTIDIDASIKAQTFYGPDRYANDEKLEVLKESIRENGFCKYLPIILWITPQQTIQILYGIRRARAALLAGVKMVPCHIMEGKSEEWARVDQIVEGIHS